MTGLETSEETDCSWAMSSERLDLVVTSMLAQASQAPQSVLSLLR